MHITCKLTQKNKEQVKAEFQDKLSHHTPRGDLQLPIHPISGKRGPKPPLRPQQTNELCNQHQLTCSFPITTFGKSHSNMTFSHSYFVQEGTSMEHHTKELSIMAQTHY